MGVLRGGQEGALAPPPGRFLDFFGKNSIFFVIFRLKVGSCPSLENFCPPLEKSLRAPMDRLFLLFMTVAISVLK